MNDAQQTMFFTDKAASKVRVMVAEQAESDDLLLRVYIEGGGCSGFKYNFGFDSKTNRDDIIFGKTIIDKSSLDIISGSVVDFKKEMIGESFVIDNPKATASCGCGLSFSV